MSVTVSEQLPLLAGAPNGIKKLRELILELAVRGKLVAQDSSDETASTLLKRISKVKKQLVVDGKIKKQKALGEIDEEEKPFLLPEGWEWQRLDCISPMSLADGDWIESKDQDPSGKIRLIQLADVGVAEFKDKSERFINEGTFKRLSCIEIKAGDILIARLPSPIGRACVFPGLPCKAITVVDVAILRTLDLVCTDYVVSAINSPCFRAQVESFGKGATRFRIATGHLKNLLIPVPPLAEQHRIVAKVDELMALCDRLEAQQADAESAHVQLVTTLLESLTRASDSDDFAASWQRLSAHFHTLFTTESSIDALKQALLQLAVMGRLVRQDSCDEPASRLLERIAEEQARLVADGKIRQPKPLAEVTKDEKLIELPKQWEWSRLGSQVMESEAGWSPSCESRPREGNGWGILKVSAVSWGNYQPDQNKALPANLEARPELEVVGGDFLVSRANTAELVARSVVVVETPGHLMMSDKIVRLKMTENCDRRYINLVNGSPWARDYYGEVSGGTSSSMKNVSREQILNLPITVPPLAEQRRIVAKFDQLIALCDELSLAIRKRNQYSVHIADALVGRALSSAPDVGTNVVDLSCYLISRLATKPTFGRTAHMKLIYLADTHLDLNLRGRYAREAAGPLDKSIYRVEEQAEANDWYTRTSAPLKSGKEKVTYHATSALAEKARKFAEELGGKRRELDRLISVLGDRNTEELEIVATLFAAWNDALLDGQSPGDDWIIREFRENWHIEKQRFSPDQLRYWLNWMRDKQLVPSGTGRHTQHQTRLL